ncbi:hypothetical protein D3C76_1420950 [compost metagenome]
MIVACVKLNPDNVFFAQGLLQCLELPIQIQGQRVDADTGIQIVRKVVLQIKPHRIKRRRIGKSTRNRLRNPHPHTRYDTGLPEFFQQPLFRIINIRQCPGRFMKSFNIGVMNMCIDDFHR